VKAVPPFRIRLFRATLEEATPGSAARVGTMRPLKELHLALVFLRALSPVQTYLTFFACQSSNPSSVSNAILPVFNFLIITSVKKQVFAPSRPFPKLAGQACSFSPWNSACPTYKRKET
jgi:hypothetical protein